MYVSPILILSVIDYLLCCPYIRVNLNVVTHCCHNILVQAISFYKRLSNRGQLVNEGSWNNLQRWFFVPTYTIDERVVSTVIHSLLVRNCVLFSVCILWQRSFYSISSLDLRNIVRIHIIIISGWTYLCWWKSVRTSPLKQSCGWENKIVETGVKDIVLDLPRMETYNIRFSVRVSTVCSGYSIPSCQNKLRDEKTKQHVLAE